MTKTYPGVIALDNLSIDFYAGEVHALLGENGAGKSTLIKLIAGAITPTSGTIETEDGKIHSVITPNVAKQYGIEVVYQEFNLISSLTVAENICFGEKKGKLVNYKLMNEIAKKTLDLFNLDINPKSPVYTLPSSKMQIVEIAKAISRKAKILIMDEPSAPLSVAEVEKMFTVIRDLKKRGVAVIYISHRMEEIFSIADRVSILRDGKYITTLNTNETNREILVNHMVGRELKEAFPEHGKPAEKVIMRVEELTGNGDSDISFAVRGGEILGFAGLVGAGRTEMARMIYGADRIDSGKILLLGREVRIHSPKSAVRNGIGLIPEDRKQQGCLLGRNIQVNITMSCLESISRLGVIKKKKELEIAAHFFEQLKIKAPGLKAIVGNLSGGNQQKVVLARTLAANSDVIIFDEPTRGIDVGAKQEIYKLIARLAGEGKAILLITSEMEELLGLSDRIIVFYEGKIAGELQKEQFSQSAVLALASGL
ncbi:MAG: sugar ABC transporter ATP-binding protein [Treponema sp.]|nr:sugar ABC transporter ATP-binding protein [Treponema sp.]